MIPTGLRRLCGRSIASIVFGGFLLAVATPANAVLVTIGSITYDLQVQSPGQNYFDQQAAIEASPWWTSDGSSQATALQFADAYIAAAGPTATPLFFAYSAPSTQFLSFGEAGGGIFGTDFYINNDAYFTAVASGTGSSLPVFFGAERPARAGAADTFRFSNFSFVTGTEVPEINGPVLAQLAVVLGVFYLCLTNVRRRRQIARLT